MKENKIQFVTLDPISDENIPKEFVIMRKNDIWKTLDNIENKLMQERHSAIQSSAVYDWMYDMCMLKRKIDDSTVYVMIKRYEPMLKIYSRGNLHTPFDLGVKEFNPLIRMFAEGDVSEC